MEVVEVPEITYSRPSVFSIYPIGDCHLGSSHCDEDRLAKKLQQIKGERNAYVIGMGDYIDAILKNDKRFDIGGLAPWVKGDNIIELQREKVKKLFNPISKQILTMLAVSADTEVLTLDGWKTYDKLSVGESVLSLNIKTGEYEYTDIKGIYPADFNDEIIHIHSRSLDQLVTPDHRILYWNDYKKKYEYRLAKTLPKNNHLIRIPIAAPYTQGGNILSDDEIQFLAWVIAEGHIDFGRSKNPTIEITQSLSSEYIEELESLFTRLNLAPHKHFHNGRKERVNEQDWVCFYFPYIQCSKYIEILGGKKEIPQLLLNGTPSQLKLLLDTLLKGDGNVNKNGAVSYYTASLNLAKQVVELCLKLGKSASIIERNRFHTYKGYSKFVATKTYTIDIHRYNRRIIRHWCKESYQGKVFCLSTGNGNFVAMRNGKPFCTGNTGNHEETVHLDKQDDITRNICKDLGVKYGGYSCFIILKFARKPVNADYKGTIRQYIIHAWHGAGAAQQEGARMMRLMRLVNDVEADIYLMGHLHTITTYAPSRLVYRNGKIKSVPIHAVMTGSWLKAYAQPKDGESLNSSYAERAGYKPNVLGCPCVKIHPDSGRIWVES